MNRQPHPTQRAAALVCLALCLTAIAWPARADVAIRTHPPTEATFLTVQAKQAPQNLRYRGYVNDFANVVEDEWEHRLTQLITELDQKTKAQIAIVTIKTLNDEPVEDFAVRLFEAWGIGYKDDRGLLLLLATEDRKSRLEVGYGLEPIIPDGYAGSVLREMRPALRQGDYGQALYAAVTMLSQRIARESGVQITGLPASATPRPTAGPRNALPFLGIVIVVLFLVIFSAARHARHPYGGFGGYEDGPMTGGFGGSRRRRRGGLGGLGGLGGFGGFGGWSGGGGGGFGGFGGGRSGGGGASSGW